MREFTLRHTSWLLIGASILALFSSANAERTPSDQFHTTPTMRFETKHLVFYLERQHYLGTTIGELDQDKLIKDFLDDFDVNRLYLRSSDIRGFEERYGESLSDFLEDGYLDPAFKMFLVFRDRVDTRMKWIMNYLDQEIPLNEMGTYAPDRSEAEWPVTVAEADELWKNRLKFEIVNELLANQDTDDDAEVDVTEENVLVNAELLEDGKMGAIVKDDSNKAAEKLKSETTDVVVVTEEAEIDDFDEKLKEAKEEIRKRYERVAKWVGEIEPTEVQEVFLTTLTHQYDPHSTYMSADTLEEFAIAMRNSLVGIGALLSDDEGYCTIRELLPGGPAEYCKQLSSGDQIVGVGQGEEGEMVDVIGMKLNKVVKMIRGKKGTTVRLLIKPGEGDPSERKTVNLIRDEIQLTAKLARAEVFEVPSGDKTIPIGVIDLPAFYGSGDSDKGHSSTTEDVEELVLKLKEIGVEGIVLDLRNNGGGLLSEAINLTGLFIPVGPVVQVKDYIGHVQEYLDQDPKVVWDGPLMVLVSRFSASASEIAAGALKNHGRALIVGDPETHGKGTVQAVFEMNRSNFLSMLKPRRGAAKVTIQKYYLPDGTSTQIKGVESDIVLPSLNMHLPIGEGDLPNALAWDRIDSLDWDYDLSPRGEESSVKPTLIDFLRKQSLQRQASLDEFDYLTDNIDWFRLRQEQKEFSLNLDNRQAKREKDLEFRDTMKDRLKELSEMNFDSDEILLQVALEQQAEHDAIVAEKESLEDKPLTEIIDGDGSAEVGAVVAAAEIPEDLEIDEEETPDFDIHLRESLRIMADWIEAQDLDDSTAQNVASTVPGQKS
ncbi:carboxy terminal-processing peptidase [Rubellicoccus peritrichatus]|uniref:Carboxy terminal-processing peptidase n=1 Tax=Rubellicoccus peritrichatus TaxID=3080537 RepID=A0AAQ3QW07_9BACT|nr:carboxy terminal-processing peptidase [Puniceicoccus sp. CR14]WOO41402.1 carboxy terminal-processing peptidase [Puniceicoccus sp. CR14]